MPAHSQLPLDEWMRLLVASAQFSLTRENQVPAATDQLNCYCCRCCCCLREAGRREFVSLLRGDDGDKRQSAAVATRSCAMGGHNE